jgi:5-methylthioadenosine/S-adenosylhomocysteine deaminase
MALVLKGRVLPMNPSDPFGEFDGRVYMNDDGFVELVSPDGGSVPTGFASAPVLNLGDAVILPGIIDLHNHLGYNALPLWSEPSQAIPFRHHNHWTDAPTYKASIGWPAWVLAKAEPEALLAYVQARALVGGTTAIQGWPAVNRQPTLIVRNIDSEKAGGTSRNLIYTSALTEKPLQLAERAQLMSRGGGFIYHCAEGQPATIVAREFTDVANAGCLQKTFIGIHCNAVSDAEWQRWSLTSPGAVVWSPFSNLWLYGSTTNIRAPRARGVAICLGSDWGPSGTKHVLAELKVAKIVSEDGGAGLSDRELVAMVTTNAGDVLGRCWSRPIGRLVPGAFGDVTVIRRRGAATTLSQIVSATERDVMLVVVDSRVRYGDVAVMTAAGQSLGAAITVAGIRRRLAILDPSDSTRGWKWSDIVARLDAVRRDPGAALRRAEGRRRSFAGSLLAPDAPLELALDMPSGGARAQAGPPPNPDRVTIPRLPSLVHDTAFFRTVRDHGFHGGVLNQLARFYE